MALTFSPFGKSARRRGRGLHDGHGPNRLLHPEMRAARARVRDACKKNKLAFLNTVRENDVEEMIKERIMSGAGASPETADKGRRFTKRKMPW